MAPSLAAECPRLQVAIIGAGITGLSLAAGLQNRGVDFTVYERSPGIREIGAGVGISPNAERALRRLSPGAQAAFDGVAMPNGEDYFQWVDGRWTDEVMYRLWVGQGMFRGCRRGDFVEALGALVEGRVRFGKEVREVEEEREGVRILFGDGSMERADVVIGCDGIHSRIRQLLLGTDSPASQPSYTHKYCFRALVPTSTAESAIGHHRASTRFMYNGPNAHIITYPVAQGTFLNVLAVITDPNPWPEGAPHILPGNRADIQEAFRDWTPRARAIAELIPEDAVRWGIFDALDHPAESYVRGRVCLAGDAAHAAGPHLGSGAGFGIEDALVLAEVLAAIDEAVEGLPESNGGSAVGQANKNKLCLDALKVYNEVRYERTQWLVGATREACDLFQWRDPEIGRDPERFGREITWRFHKIWHHDVDAMVREALEKLAIKGGELEVKIGLHGES